MTTWNPLDAPMDRCEVMGHITPGLCEVAGASSPRKWDEQAGYAMTGAILIYRGIALSRFTLRFKLLTREHWEEWAAIRPILMRPPIGQRAKALDIDHPQLNEVGITHMVVEDVTAPEQTEDGVWTIECKCIEWRRHGVALSKPDGAEATPHDPREQKIGELTSEKQMLQAAVDKGNP